MPLYQVIAKGRWSDSLDETRNIFTVNADGDSLLLQLTDWCTDLWVSGDNPLQDIITDKWAMYSVEIKIWSGDHWLSVAETPVTVAGTYIADPMPHLIAACVTGLTVSRARPKKYIAGLCEPHNSSGAIVGGALVQLANFGALWTATTPITGGEILPVAYNPEGGGSEHPIVGFRINSLFSTQRRRKQGRGI